MIEILRTFSEFEVEDGHWLFGEMPAIEMLCAPEDIRDGDFVAGYQVTDVSQAEHDGHPAVRFALSDEMGQRTIGRLVLRKDAQHDAQVHAFRDFNSNSERDAFIERVNSAPDGFEWRLARTLVGGEFMQYKTVAGEDKLGVVAGVGIVMSGGVPVVSWMVDHVPFIEPIEHKVLVQR